MGPGKALDALVAEKVMGWERIAGGHPEIEAASGMWRTPKGPRMAMAFSTNISAAWMVVEAMRAKGYRFTLTDQPGTRIKFAQFFNAEEYGASVGEVEEPLAICNAALGAIGYIEGN